MPLKVVSSKPASTESEELQALRRGEITLSEFLDRKADRAVAGMLRKGLVTEEEAAAVRDVVRLQMEIDPRTVAEVRALTGMDPQRAAQ